eukprot:267774-Rhodomonas_salina.2
MRWHLQARGAEKRAKLSSGTSSHALLTWSRHQQLGCDELDGKFERCTRIRQERYGAVRGHVISLERKRILKEV